MRVLCFLAVFAGFPGGGEALAQCSSDDQCLRAVNRAPSQVKASDCENYLQGTATPPISTVTSSTTIKITGTVTNTVTQIAAATSGPSKRWQEEHGVVDHFLRRRLPQQSSSTFTAPEVPDYASPCRAVDAYASACSCLGFKSRTTAAGPVATVTSRVQKTATATALKTVSAMHNLAMFGNLTRTGFVNSAESGNLTHPLSRSRRLPGTSSGISLSSMLSNSSSTPEPSLTPEATSSPSNRLTRTPRPTNIDSLPSATNTATPSSRKGPVLSLKQKGVFNTTSNAVPPLANSTTARANATGSKPSPVKVTSGPPLNTTAAPVLSQSTTAAPFLNPSTRGLVFNTTGSVPITKAAHAPSNLTMTPFPLANTTSTPPLMNTTTTKVPFPFVNATTTAPFSNASAILSSNATKLSFPFANVTAAAPISNTTSVLAFNATKPPFPMANMTTSASFLNATGMPPFNITRLPFANATTRAWNTTAVRFSNTTSPTATPTPTLDSTCGETATSFTLQVSQPAGLFDGWFAKILGSTIIFTSSANHSTKFSVEASGHLCAVGFVGGSGKPAIAIVENKKGLTGSGVYLADVKRLEQLEDQGYGALDCQVDGDLACTGGQGLRHWVGCGLGLNIASDPAGVVVVDEWNCTSVALSPVYD